MCRTYGSGWRRCVARPVVCHNYLAAMSSSRTALSDAEAHRLVESFNDRRTDALAALARRHRPGDVEAVRLTSVDEEGILLRLGTGKDSESLRVTFAERATGPEDARAKLEELLGEASA